MDKCVDGKQRHVHLYSNSAKISLFMNVPWVIGFFFVNFTIVSTENVKVEGIQSKILHRRKTQENAVKISLVDNNQIIPTRLAQFSPGWEVFY